MFKIWFFRMLFLAPFSLYTYISHSDITLNQVRRLYNLSITKTETTLLFQMSDEQGDSRTNTSGADIQLVAPDVTYQISDIDSSGGVAFNYQIKFKGNPQAKGGYFIYDTQFALRMNRQLNNSDCLFFQAIEISLQTNNLLNIIQKMDGKEMAFWNHIPGSDQIFLSKDYSSRFLALDRNSYQKSSYKAVNMSVYITKKDLDRIENGSYFFQWYILMDPLAEGTTQDVIDSLTTTDLNHQKTWVEQEISLIKQMLLQQVTTSEESILKSNQQKFQDILDKL